MGFLSQRLSSLLLGLLLLAVPVSAFVPTDPFISELSESRKELIRAGHTAPYNQLTVQRVVVGKAKIMPNGAIINLPYGPEFIPSFHDLQHNPKWQPKEKILGDLKFDHSAFAYNTDKKLLIDILFWTSHAADIYTTYRGVKYECISEANPLLPTVPNLGEMFTLKATVIWGVKTAFMTDIEYGELWWDDWKLSSGLLTSVVAYNNHRITKKAIRRGCKKR
jgi:hypothetical protein